MTAGDSFELWGGRADVWVTDDTLLAEAVTITRSVIAEIDRTCSSYRSDSELTRFNDSVDRQRSVSPALLAAIKVALLAAAATDGLTDPTVGSVTLPEYGPLPQSGVSIRLHRHGPTGRWNDVVIDDVQRTVRLPEGVRLDLGATAKAWCADLAAHRIAAELGCGALVNLCGDIATAGPAPADGWDLLVADDHRWNGSETTEAQQSGARITVRTGALATSSTTVRRQATSDGASVAHVVDPRTHRPAAGPYRTVSVAAATCTEANAAATAALVRGHGARRWLSESRMPARLVRCDGSIELTGGWPQ